MADGERWRVAIVDDHERSRAALRTVIRAAGGAVVGEAARRADALHAITRTAADVAIIAVGLPDGDGVSVASDAANAGCPVVLFTSHTSDALVRRASDAGVMGYLVKPLRAPELAPALDIAVARFRESRDLRRALTERKVVERAKGVLMARHGFTEDEAFRRLRRAAMDTRRPMVDVARALLVSDAVVPART